VNVNATNHTPCDTCVTLSANVSGGTAPYTYQWYINSQLYNTGQTINYCNKYPWTFSGDSVMLIVTDVNSQQAFYYNGISNFMTSTIDNGNDIGYKYCIATVDSATGKNLLIWEQTTNPSVVSYNIFKQNTSSVFTVIANVPRNSFSTFIDTSSNPSQVSAAYEISIVDSCGFESYLSYGYINTIHLAISAGIFPAWNLVWNSTQGYPIVKYRIWRATTLNNPVLIDSVPNSIYAYTDLTPPSGVLYYTIEAVSTSICSPSLKTSQDNFTYSSSFSNVANNGLDGISENNFSSKLRIFPNPFSSTTTLQTYKIFKNATLTVYNSFGQQVKQIKNIFGQTITLHRDDMPSGLYFLRLMQDNKTFVADKLIITDK